MPLLVIGKAQLCYLKVFVVSNEKWTNILSEIVASGTCVATSKSFERLLFGVTRHKV